MCIIYEEQENAGVVLKIFIHIPRTGGKAWRRHLRAGGNIRILKELWGVYCGYDRAHTPCSHLYMHVGDPGLYELYSFTRDPYQRLLSAFAMKYGRLGAIPGDFQRFVKEVLPLMIFNERFSADIIHFYPQFLFVGDPGVSIEMRRSDASYDRRYLDDWYDAESYAIADRIYREDFDMFGYSPVLRMPRLLAQDRASDDADEHPMPAHGALLQGFLESLRPH